MSGNRTLHVPGKAKRFASTAAAGSLPTNLYADQAQNFFFTVLNLFPDFDEVLRRAGLSRAELRKLESDDEITAATDTRREAVISTGWHFEGPDGTPLEGEDVDFIQDQFDAFGETLLRGAWAAVPFGYSVMETVYAKAGGRVVIDHMSEKPFEWFTPRFDGKLIYRPIDIPQGVEVDTKLKFFHTVREPSLRQPYGRALYSQLYWPWFYRKMGWQFWMKYLERWGVPFLVGHTSGDAKAMAEALAKMVQNASAAVGMDDKVDVVSGGNGSVNFSDFESKVTARIQKLVLGQTLTSDAGGSSGKSGSFALGKVHNDVRQDRRNADLRLVKRTMQRQVDALWILNQCAGKPPCFIFEGDTDIQIERAQRDSQLMSSGAIKLTPAYFERVYDFEEGEVLPGDGPKNPLDPNAPAEPDQVDENGQPVAKAARRVMTAARSGERFTREQQAVEDLIANTSQQLSSPVDPNAIRNAIRAAKDPSDLVDRLGVLFANADPYAFAQIVERAIFAGHIMGFAHAGAPVGEGAKAAAEIREGFARLEASLTGTPREQHVHIHEGATTIENEVVVPPAPKPEVHFHAPEPRAVLKTITGPNGENVGTVREEPQP